MSENNHPVSQEDFKAAEERLKLFIGDQIERLEAKLLTAFHGWARSIEVRVRTDEAAAHGMD